MEKLMISHGKEETQLLGERISNLLSRGDVVLLKGDLGAGKTTFSGGVAKGLGIKESVISPTFNIMKCYFDGTIPLYHIDAYRLENQNIEIGLDEYIEGDGICLIEWPDFISPLLPEERLEIFIEHAGEDKRNLKLVSYGKHFDEVLEKLA